MYGLQQSEIDQIIAILNKYPEVNSAKLWGSRARGNSRPGSDIDLVLQGDDVTVSIMNQIAWEFDELLLPYSFDLSIDHLISNADVRQSIARHGIELYSRQTSP